MARCGYRGYIGTFRQTVHWGRIQTYRHTVCVDTLFIGPAWDGNIFSFSRGSLGLREAVYGDGFPVIPRGGPQKSFFFFLGRILVIGEEVLEQRVKAGAPERCGIFAGPLI